MTDFNSKNLNDRFNEIITRDLDQSNIRVDTAGTIGEL